jgi:ribonucleoside-diphosphate reductase alpha chain
MQSMLTDFPYIGPDWIRNTREEALLGVSMTGIFDNPLTYSLSESTEAMLHELRDYANEINNEYSRIFDVNRSAAITCVKPSGTVSSLVNCASGIHPRFAKHYIRRMAITTTDPISRILSDFMVPNEPYMYQKDQTVFEFPIAAPDNCITIGSLNVLDHLNTWKMYNTHWCEHKPSITVYVGDSEWPVVREWVRENYDWVSGIAFLPKDDSIYPQRPYEEITQARYQEMAAKFPKDIDWSLLKYYEKTDTTEAFSVLACTANGCDTI